MENEITLRPIYADTDAEGVVYYATYLAWLEKGRTELIRDTGFTVADLRSQGLIFAVRKVSLDYFQPAHYDELLLVRTRVTEVKGARIVFEQAVVHRETKQILLQGSVLLIAVDVDTFKPKRVPAALVDRI